MPASADGVWQHARDRRLLPTTAVRSVLCLGLAAAPLLVTVPTQQHLVSIAYFLPLVFGVLGALGLREHVQWLRPRNRMLRIGRGALTVTADALCVSALALTTGGQPERVGLVSGALLAIAAALAVACLAQDLAWVGASLVGFVCLLEFDQAVILHLPFEASLAAYVTALCAFSLRGPVAR